MLQQSASRLFARPYLPFCTVGETVVTWYWQRCGGKFQDRSPKAQGSQSIVLECGNQMTALLNHRKLSAQNTADVARSSIGVSPHPHLSCFPFTMVGTVFFQATARATAPLSEEMEAIIASLPQAAQLAARAAAASVSTSADGSSGTTNSIGAVGTPEVGVDLDGNGGAAPSLRELLAAQSVALNADDPPLEGPEEFRMDAVMPEPSMPAPAGSGAKVVASETKAGLWPPAKADPRETTGSGYIQRGAASGRLRSAIPPHSAAHTESTRVEWLGDWS
eukprot:2293435-Pleurochrysis_carterae.AAC.1